MTYSRAVEVCLGATEGVCSASRWPVWVRRVFVLTSPISWAVWLVLMFACVIASIVAAIGVIIVDGLAWLWSGEA